jgi:hypothetical protein
MTNSTQHGSQGVTSVRQQLQESYDAFKAKGLKLDLTRGKPSSGQLDLTVEMLSLPGSTAVTTVACRD